MPLGTNSPLIKSTSRTSTITSPLEIILTKSVPEAVPISDDRENVSDMGAEVIKSVEQMKSVRYSYYIFIRTYS